MPELPSGVANLYLTCSSKSLTLAPVKTRKVCLDLSFVSLPTMTPSLTDQYSGSPSQPVRSLPLKMVIKPSAPGLGRADLVSAAVASVAARPTARAETKRRLNMLAPRVGNAALSGRAGCRSIIMRMRHGATTFLRWACCRSERLQSRSPNGCRTGVESLRFRTADPGRGHVVFAPPTMAVATSAPIRPAPTSWRWSQGCARRVLRALARRPARGATGPPRGS